MLNVPENVKRQYRRDSVPKNMRIHFPKGELQDITNDNIISESVALTESLCSRNNLKFGLCEASVFECEVAGIDQNIKGYEIVVTQEISYEDDAGRELVYSMPYGTFTINSCKRQANMSRRKIIAYDALYAKSLDADETELVNDIIQYPYKYTGAGELFKRFAVPNLYLILKTLTHKYNMGYKAKTKDYEVYNGDTYGRPEKVLYSKADGSQRISIGFTNVKLYGLASGEQYSSFRIKDSVFSERKSSLRDFLEKNNITQEIIDNALGFEYLIYADLGEDTDPEVPIGILNRAVFANVNNYPLFHIFYLVKISHFDSKTGSWVTDAQKDWGAGNMASLLKDNLSGNFVISYMESKEISGKIRYRDLTPRKFMESVYELIAEFGGIDRETGELAGRRINNMALYPDVDLYPSNDLYPMGPDEVLLKSTYEKLWHEEYSVKPIGKINAKYQTLDKEGNETTAVYSYVFNSSFPNVYTMDNNWLLQNVVFEESEIRNMLTGMAGNMGNTAFVPIEAAVKGLPYLQAGDDISFYTNNGGVRSYILKRVLKGIHSLTDTIQSSGNEMNTDTAVKGG